MDGRDKPGHDDTEAMMTAKRAALVTGASYGVGAATALALARDGFAVAVTATDVARISRTQGARTRGAAVFASARCTRGWPGQARP